MHRDPNDAWVQRNIVQTEDTFEVVALVSALDAHPSSTLQAEKGCIVSRPSNKPVYLPFQPKPFLAQSTVARVSGDRKVGRSTAHVAVPASEPSSPPPPFLPLPPPSTPPPPPTSAAAPACSGRGVCPGGLLGAVATGSSAITPPDLESPHPIFHLWNTEERSWPTDGHSFFQHLSNLLLPRDQIEISTHKMRRVH